MKGRQDIKSEVPEGSEVQEPKVTATNETTKPFASLRENDIFLESDLPVPHLEMEFLEEDDKKDKFLKEMSMEDLVQHLTIHALDWALENGIPIQYAGIFVGSAVAAVHAGLKYHEEYKLKSPGNFGVFSSNPQASTCETAASFIKNNDQSPSSTL